MRIGIHTGRVVAGIIGSKVVRYDIFGDGVLIANKMETHGIPGKVCISEETRKIL
jgi:class 3 adenylate cyclase